jgi:PAS domain S-box-containing protein
LLSLSFSVKINFILGLGLAILIAVGSIALRSVDSLVDASSEENRAFSAISSLERVVGAVRRAESAARKYALTGEVADLTRYRAARSLVITTRSELEMAGSSITQDRRLSQLRVVVRESLDRFDELSRTRQQSGAGAAAALVRGGRSDEASLRMQILADQFRDTEMRTLRNLGKETSITADNTSFLVFWGLAFAFALLVWAMLIIHRHQAGRLAAEAALKASEAQLRLITNAVPALIGYVNRDGRLLFHNRAFEQWFGRSESELRELTLSSLMGEVEYAKVAPQVERVLAGEATNFDFPLHMGGRGILHLSVQLVPRLEDGAKERVPGFYALATDISALKEVDRLKSEFVTTVSHELRTPLTSIRGSLGLLAAGVTGALPDKARQLVLIAVQNCERLVRLVNDILDSEKMLSGKMELKITRIDAAALIRRAITETEGYARQHGVTVQLTEAGGKEVQVMGDSDRLLQVVINLLSNACKFSPHGGVVEVALRRDTDQVVVTVADRGPGVPKPLQARLFERFAQLDSTDAQRRAGTGLGLNICKSIIEHHGGRIGFAEREGGGSLFHFTLQPAPEGGSEAGHELHGGQARQPAQ